MMGRGGPKSSWWVSHQVTLSGLNSVSVLTNVDSNEAKAQTSNSSIAQTL